MADEPTTEVEFISACVDSFGGAVGMPQLCTEWFGNQIFWLVITLVIIYLVLAKIALPRISAVLAERSGTITNDLAAAEDLKAKAVEAEEAYHKALADARAEAQTIIAKTKSEIKAELDKATAKADAEIAAKAAEGEAAIAEIKANAMESVKDVAKAVAGELVGAMGSKADAKAITGAVNARMKG
ncbi:MAG: F0F1 ATP synthase subunit B' [Pseudomonadota bacterium]